MAGFTLRVLKIHGGRGEEYPDVYSFPGDRERVRLGRSTDCDVVLPHEAISRCHAEIVRTADGYLLVDSNSANGVWVENDRVQEFRLEHGQQFRLGGAYLQFLVAQPAVAAPVVAAPAVAAPAAPAPGAPARTAGAPAAAAPASTVAPSAAELAEPMLRTAAETQGAGADSDSTEVMRAEGVEVAAGGGIAEVFRREGELVGVAGNRPLLLDGNDNVWFVENGKLEVFTVTLEGGKPVGSRSHFVSIGAGQLVFGMDLQGFGMGAGFLAVGKIGTELRRLSLNRLHELARIAENGAEIAQLIDTWIAVLSRGLITGITLAPRVDVNLLGGEATELQNQQRARANRGVVWLEVVRGNLLFVGMEELLFWEDQAQQQESHHSTEVPLGDLFAEVHRSSMRHVLFPITTDTWIEASNARDLTTELETFSAGEVAADPSLWRGLQVFHEVLCQCEFINKRLAAVDEANRLRSKAEYSQAAEDDAYREIAQVLERPVAEQVLPDVDGVQDPILAVCSLVGAALGITVRSDPDPERNASYDERVNAIARASRVRTRQVALRDDWWRHDHGPILATREESGEPVALLPSGATAYVAVDPVSDTRQPVTEQLAEKLDLFGRIFYRSFPDGALRAWDLVRFGSRGLLADAWTLLAMGMSLGLLGAIVPVITGKLFDAAIPQADRGALLQYTAALFAAALVSAAFGLTRSVAVLRIQGRMDYSIQAALWDRLLDLPATFFRDYSAGDLANRAAGINTIRGLVAGTGVSAVLGLVSSVFYVVLMFVYSVPLAALGIGLTVVFVSFTTGASYLQLKFQREELHRLGKISGMVHQFISGVTKLRVAGAENHAFRVWAREFAAQRRIQVRTGRIQNSQAVFGAGFPVFSSMAVFFLLMKVQEAAAAQGALSPLTTGEFIAFNAAYGTFLGAMQALADSSLDLLRSVPIYERLKPIITTEAEIDESKAYPGTLKGEIELSHIRFRYVEDSPWVLDDISLKIAPGEMLAFVGGSGCGKSTLLRLMLGFETPVKGSVYYDGQDLGSLDLREVRQQLGVVLQDSKLLPASIFQNIIGAGTGTIGDAWEAARLAGLADDIEQLPMGMHTFVGEGGGGFSGGQQQRLLIARSLVRKPRIIFLDEATSALDNRSQSIVTESMDRLQATRIVVAHRLSTIRNADRICFLEGGKIVEMGTFDELMKLDGRFAELAKRQLV